MPKEVTMDQPCPSGGQPAEPAALPRPVTPAPVLTAVKLMYACAAVGLIISLALIPGIRAALRTAHPSLTAAQVSDVNTLITLALIFGLVMTAARLWMARAASQGSNRARIAATVIFGLAMLDLLRRPQYPGSHLAHFAVGGHVYSVIRSVFGAAVLGLIAPVLTWLAGLAAVCLLWRPASSAFFGR
jgi:hypothetical protein